MQKNTTSTITGYSLQGQGSSPLSLVAKKSLEKIKLQLRANKYQYKEDRGGVAYLLHNVKEGDTVLDIGAHKGGYLYLLLQQVGKTGIICAFEPQTVLNNYLTKLKQILHWDNVRIEPSAVSDSSGRALLCVPFNHGRNSSPCATIIESHMAFDFSSKEEVATVTIDDYCNKHQLVPDFLKVDVEGNELAVFRGAKEILAKHHPKLLFESEVRFVGEQRVSETFAFLQNLGYNGYFIIDAVTRPIGEFSFAKHQNPSSGTYCNNFIFEQ